MVQLGDQGAGQVAQRDEVEDVVVLVERPVDLDGHAPVVAVDALALVAVEGDEVPGAEDEVVLGDADGVAVRFHDRGAEVADRTIRARRPRPSPTC